MITDTDIKKMKKVFVTKDDLKELAKQKDLLRLETKVDTVKGTLDELVDVVGAIFEWTDDIHRAIVGKPTKRTSGN